MAIVVESVGTAEFNLGSTSNFTVTFDKPSGLVVGDLMIGCFVADGGSTAITSLTLTGWTALPVANADAETCQMFMLYKVAVSADVSATDFTFTTNYSGTGGGKVGGAILRVSGYAVGTTPVVTTDVDPDKNTTGASFTSFESSFTPNTDNSLLIFAVVGANNETGSGGFSGYTVSGSNPSWTERFDIFDADGDDVIFAVATAVETTATTRTTATATCSVAQNDYILVLASFEEAVNASGTTSLLAVSPTIFTPSASAGVSGNSALLSVTTTIPTQSGRSTSPSQWTNEAKENTTWTNEDTL